MIYLVASIASLVMLAAALSVIFLTVRASESRIIGALLGQPVDRPLALDYKTRSRTPVRASARQQIQPLRAAA